MEYLETRDLTTTTISKRVRPNKAAATALLARVYLYTGEWDKAELEASKVIAQTGIYSLLNVDDIFLRIV